MSFSKASDLLRLAMMATGRRGVCLADIEEEFGCVRRTCQRMIEALQHVFPATEHYVGDDHRHYWRLPSRAVSALLTPTAEELAATSTAIKELEVLGLLSEASRLQALDRKVRSLLPAESGTRLAVDEEALLEALGYAARPGPRPVLNMEVDEVVSTCLKGPFEMRLSYKGRMDEKARQRIVQPYGLLLGARRYLVARDVSRSDGRLRHFRVEDILQAEQLDTSFELPEDFHLADYAERAFGSFHNDDEFGEVVWLFAPRAAEHAKRYVFHPQQVTEEQDDGSLLVRFYASGHLEMCWHLYSWGDCVEVLAPLKLKEMVAAYRRDDFPGLP